MTAFTRIARAVLAAMILMLGGAVPALSETAGATERSELPVVTLATAEKTRSRRASLFRVRWSPASRSRSMPMSAGMKFRV